MSLMHLTDSLSLLPPDPLLGLMANYKEDSREKKFDLSVGVYRDKAGHTPIMQAVKRAEIENAERTDTKVYEGQRGNAAFCSAIEQLILGPVERGVKDRITSLATPGGCGALYLAVKLHARMNPSGQVWISNPSWPNHKNVAHGIERKTSTYKYTDVQASKVDIDGMLTDLSEAQAGDLVILQGACHNPTGIDLDISTWRDTAYMAAKRGFILLIDTAYHGLGEGLSEDAEPIREVLKIVPEALIAYSCSKNFGLYRERTGCLIALATSLRSAQATASHLTDIARSCYSMPPANGQAIVARIFTDAILKSLWIEELECMRERLNGLRKLFACAFDDTSLRNLSLRQRRGMFLQLPLSRDSIEAMRSEHGIFMPRSGRVNIAGLSENNAEHLGQIIAGSIFKN